jgi:hypothetical protein
MAKIIEDVLCIAAMFLFGGTMLVILVGVAALIWQRILG